MKKALIGVFLLPFFWGAAAGADEHPLKVAMVISRTQSDLFFAQSTSFMKVAANSLGVKLEIIEANDNHLNAGPLVVQALAKPGKPDGVIAISNKESGVAMLEACEAANTPFMTEVATILTAGFGGPREKHSFFIGEILPDDEQAGYDLATYLIAHGKVGSDGKVHVLGFSGPLANSSSVEREKGLMRAIKEMPRAILDQLVNADWSKDIASDKFTVLKKRYPEASVAWAASDSMALGVANAGETMKLKLGTELVIGGVDGTPEGVEAIKKNRIQASASGLFMEEAWALVAMFDYLNQHDFAATDGVRMKTTMRLVTAKNVNAYSVLLDRNNWEKIDFRKFSRTFNPKMKRYDFSMDRVLREISSASAKH